MRRGLGRLESGDLQAEIGECIFSLASQLMIRRRNLGEVFSWNREALAIDEVGWGRANVWLDGRSDGEQSHWETPKPSLGLV